MFDGNVWAELKGKTFSGLVIQRVDCDMVVANSSVAKAFVSFTVTVNAADITAGVTNKDIIIPAYGLDISTNGGLKITHDGTGSAAGTYDIVVGGVGAYA